MKNEVEEFFIAKYNKEGKILRNPAMEFFLSKYEKEISSENYLLIESKDKNPLIVEERLFCLMLSRQKMPEELMNLDYVFCMGWHVGNDQRVYDRYKLSDAGEMAYFIVLNNEIKRYKEAYDCINNFTVNKKVVNEIAEIINFYHAKKIKSVTPYDEKEICEKDVTKVSNP